MAADGDASRRRTHASCTVGEYGKNDTIYMNERIDREHTVTSNHLEVEASLLNSMMPFMRRVTHGTVFFDTPFRVHSLVAHNCRRYAALISERGEDEIEKIARSMVSITHGGSLRRFHTPYRNGYIQLAERFRGIRQVSYSVLDALAIPHVFCSTRRGEHDDAHIVLFVAYPKHDPRTIVMYDSTFMTAELVPVPRCSEEEIVERYKATLSETHANMSHAERVATDDDTHIVENTFRSALAHDDKTFAMQRVFHDIENYMCALDMVNEGLAIGRDTVRYVTAPESRLRGAFHPTPCRFYRTGFGVAQRSFECGLFTMYGMNDLARYWRDPSRVHVMSSTRAAHMSARELFSAPRLKTKTFVCMLVTDLMRKYLLNWHISLKPYDLKREYSRTSTAVLCQPQMKEYYDIICQCIETVYSYTFAKRSDRGKVVDVPWISAPDLECNENIDFLFRIVDCAHNSDRESDIYDSIARAFPYIRFLITIVPGMSVTVNYKESKDHRVFLPTPDNTFIYRVDKGLSRMARQSDEHTVRSVLQTTFVPEQSTQRDAYHIELPDESDYVQWIRGVGWMPIASDK